MAEFKDDFKFPDEVEDKGKSVEVEEKIEIEIEDDTPKEDRGRKAAPPPEEVTDDELATYDEKVQARIKKFTRGYHDERRAKEEAIRERGAAETYAKQIIGENRKLQEQVALGSRAYIEQSKSSAEVEVENAKRRFKEARDSGDDDAQADAQVDIAKATLNLDKAQNMRPLQVEEKDVQIPQRSAAPVVNVTERDERWRSSNKWFGPDPEMTASALGLHQKLARDEGLDFIGTDSYYKKIDATMRRRFPEQFEDVQSEEPDGDDTSYRATKPANVVAPASRSTPPNRIKLKASEVAIARRLGVPLELYAKQVAILKRSE